MEPSSRDRILESLRLSPNSTVEDLSRSLNLTRADIRYHLNALLNAGLVVQMPSTTHLAGHPRGRPAKAYQLSAAARADSLAQLAHVLLSMIQEADSAANGLQTLADHLHPTSSLNALESHLSHRLNEVIQTFNQRPYQARWEAHAAGPLVFFHNCPFAAIIRQHPELCQVDQLSLENLTRMSALQTKKIDLDGPGSSVCIFKLAQAQSSTIK